MPSAPRRKAKNGKKIRTLTTPNNHSSPSVQLQETGLGNCDLKPLKDVVVEEDESKIKGRSLSALATVCANHSKMEGSLSEEAHKVDSLIEDKEVSDEVDAGGDGISKSLSEENSGLVESGKVEETQDASEPNDFSDPIKAAQVDNRMVSDTVELELKEEEGKDFQSPDNNELSSVSRNEGLQETEVVETVKDLTVSEEEKNDLSSVVTEGLLKEGEEPNEIYNFSSQPPTDVASKETQETIIPKSDESDKVPPTITGEVPKGIERSLVPSMVEKVEEHLDAQESSYETAKDSFQPSANVTDDESTSVTVQNQTEAPRSTEDSLKSCCGLFEILRRGDR